MIPKGYKPLGVTSFALPIEYRNLTREDFLPEAAYRFEKVEIASDGSGYVNAGILEKIDSESDTTIINVGTGQGKTTAIIEKIRDFYYGEQGYFIIVASPTKALVSKYYDAVIKILEDVASIENDVVDYQEITENGNFRFNTNHRILIATINLLLGNPGEDGFLQNPLKRDYLKNVRDHCRDSGRKVIMILDEVHEGDDNFQPQYYPNLLTWREITHKIIVLSATYTESAVVVLRQLAALTGNKVKVIESERIKVGTQADLHILFIAKEYTSNFPKSLYAMKGYLKRAAELNLRINILSFSKNLADKIADKKSGFSKGLTGETSFNLVTADSGNVYDPNKNNIGTTFKSGVNIDAENNLFVIILPFSQGNTKEEFKSQKYSGIFSNGAHEIIQAVARVRKGGDILLVAPVPKFIIKGDYLKVHGTTFPFNTIEPGFIKGYIPHSDHKNKVKNFYDYWRDQVQQEIQFLDSERNNNRIPKIHWPTFDEYMLEEGQRYLSYHFEICGYRVTPFALWAAYNDQFANCRLKSIIYKPIIEFNLNSTTIIQDLINTFNNEYENVPHPNNSTIEISEVELKIKTCTDKEGLDYLLNELKENTVKLDGKVVKPLKNGKIYRALMQIIRAIKIDATKLNEEYILKNYIAENLAIISVLDENRVVAEEKALFLIYKRFMDVRNQFISLFEDIRIIAYNYAKGRIIFPDGFLENFTNVVTDLRANDDYARNTFDLKLNFNENNTIEEKKKRAYKFLIKQFKEFGEPGRIRSTEGNIDYYGWYDYDIPSSPLPNPNFCLNFNFSKSFTRAFLPENNTAAPRGSYVISQAPSLSIEEEEKELI